MPTLNAARESVYQRWVTGWGVTTPFVFEAEHFDPPGDSPPWARVSVLNLESQQETLGSPGSRRFIRAASAIIKLYGRPDLGRKPLDDLAQSARALFEGVSFDGLHFRGALAREGPAEERWLSAVVEAPFFYEETK